jgi:hypothetical protein
MCKTYTWPDHGHVYDMSSGKIVPQTWHGWFALTKIVSKEFMDAYVNSDPVFCKLRALMKDGKNAKEAAKQEAKKANKKAELLAANAAAMERDREAKEAKKAAKKADKKAKLLAANAAAMERDREAKEAIKKKYIDHPVPVSTTKITPEQVAAAELREKERLRQLELEEKAAKKALRDLKIKTKGKKVKHC